MTVRLGVPNPAVATLRRHLLERVGAAVVLLMLLCLLAALRPVEAQQSDASAMTVDELAELIAEKKRVLEQVEQNRNLTEEKAQRVRDEIAAQEARRAAVESEMQKLCAEQEEIEPGSLEACLAEMRR